MLWSSAEEAVAAAGSSPLSSPISPGKAGELGHSNPRCTEPCSLSVLRAYRCISVYIYVCVFVCVWGTYMKGNRKQSLGEHQLFLPEETGLGQTKQNPRGLWMGFPRIFLFPLNFCIAFPLVAVAVSHGCLPRSPWPVRTLCPALSRPRPLLSSLDSPGSISRSSSLELFLPSVLTGCSRCPLGVYKEKIWQGLPSQQSPTCSKRT